MYKVSVIVPVYNVEKYLARCLNSILDQTYSDYEIICVDDYSTDNCRNILADYAYKYIDKIKVIYNEKNLGLGRTRERGIKAAQGQYLMFVDSDDYVKTDFISTYMDAAEKNGCDVVIGGYIKDIDNRLIEHKVRDSIWSIISYTIACAKLFRKKFLEDNYIKFSEIRCGEDIFFSMCVYCASPSFVVVDYAGYYYFFNRKSITGSMNYDKELEKFVSSIFDEFLHKYKLASLPGDKQRVIEYNYLTNMINALITYGHGCGIKKMTQKYHFFMNDLQKKFPHYKSNPYIGLLKPKGQSYKIRVGVGVVMGLHKIHLDKIFFNIISLL